MNRDEIIKLAREAGFHNWYSDKSREYLFGCVVKFAELVAAAEREACAITAWSAGMDAHTKASLLADPREIGSICAREIRSRSAT